MLSHDDQVYCEVQRVTAPEALWLTTYADKQPVDLANLPTQCSGFSLVNTGDHLNANTWSYRWSYIVILQID